MSRKYPPFPVRSGDCKKGEDYEITKEHPNKNL